MADIKTFLKKTSWFLLLPLALLLVALAALDRKTSQLFNGTRLPANVTKVFAGDSHVAECADDRIIPNSVNTAQTAEGYYFTYFKLKKLLENNPGIDTVYLGFGYHNISVYNDDFVFGEFSAYTASKYFFILPNAEKARVLWDNSENLSLFLKNSMRDALERDFVGGYENSFSATAAVPKSMDKRMAFQFYKKGELLGFSDFSLGWVEKIAQLCRERKVGLVLFNTPLHPYYKGRIPGEFVEQYGRFVAAHEYRLLDLSGFPMGDSCYIPDGDHVSARGAELVSKYLAGQPPPTPPEGGGHDTRDLPTEAAGSAPPPLRGGRGGLSGNSKLF